ncbi:MAG TPA: hypothetical protein VGZ73_15895 [Bryobacteraceae bacterium]|nr:hypothetical protein [Bryobacteraceae bacterium]
MRAAVRDQAELIAASPPNRLDLTYQSDQEMEKAHVQYVSGWMFGSFGPRPASGRLLTEDDDLKPGAHPFAVRSYDYWTRRFARDPKIAGRTFRRRRTACGWSWWERWRGSRREWRRGDRSLLVLDTVAERAQPQAFWDEATEHFAHDARRGGGRPCWRFPGSPFWR